MGQLPSALTPTGGRSPQRAKSRRLSGYERAWAQSVPAEQAPLGLAPSAFFLRGLLERYPEVMLRWDRRPRRQCFVLWEKTRRGDWVVIKDVPKGHPLDQRLYDYLALCDLAQHGGIQNILNEVDERFEAGKEAKKVRDGAGKTDWDKIMWAGKRDLREAESTPYGLFGQVPKKFELVKPQ